MNAATAKGVHHGLPRQPNHPAIANEITFSRLLTYRAIRIIVRAWLKTTNLYADHRPERHAVFFMS